MSADWYRVEMGQGRPLVLLHGIGMSHAAWLPVMPLLARERRVIAFDIAGFGRTPALSAGLTPTHENLLASLIQTLQSLGITAPVDFAGNSLGGHLALVAAREGHARSVVALSPGGLWPDDAAPLKVRFALKMTRFATRRLTALAEPALHTRLGRTLAFAVPMTSQGWRIPADVAVETARTFNAATAFDETLVAATRFTGGRAIEVPVTIAFGTRDWLLTRECQRHEELPEHTRWLHPHAWGHVPMWDDPEAVAKVIVEGTV